MVVRREGGASRDSMGRSTCRRPGGGGHERKAVGKEAKNVVIDLAQPSPQYSGACGGGRGAGSTKAKASHESRTIRSMTRDVKLALADLALSLPKLFFLFFLIPDLSPQALYFLF